MLTLKLISEETERVVKGRRESIGVRQNPS